MFIHYRSPTNTKTPRKANKTKLHIRVKSRSPSGRNVGMTESRIKASSKSFYDIKLPTALTSAVKESHNRNESHLDSLVSNRS